MTDQTSDPAVSSDRREFIGKMAASAVVLATTACASAPASVSAAPAPTPPQGAPRNPGGGPAVAAPPVQWNNSWFDTVRSFRHKAVFEQAGLEVAGAHSMALRWIIGMRDAQIAKPGDFHAVIVLRVQAVPLILTDAMWEKYGIGEALKLKALDDTIQKTNPLAARRPRNGRTPPPNDPMRPSPNIPWFTANGHTTLACNMAFTSFAWETATRVNAERDAIVEEFRANLLPGVILQPNGVYATLRAQEAGCTHIRSGS